MKKYTKQIQEYQNAREQIYVDSARHMYAGCREFSARYPKRKMEISLGNGFAILEVEGKIAGKKVIWEFNIGSPRRFCEWLIRELHIVPPQQFLDGDNAEADLGLRSLTTCLDEKRFLNGKQL